MCMIFVNLAVDQISVLESLRSEKSPWESKSEDPPNEKLQPPWLVLPPHVLLELS